MFLGNTQRVIKVVWGKIQSKSFEAHLLLTVSLTQWPRVGEQHYRETRSQERSRHLNAHIAPVQLPVGGPVHKHPILVAVVATTGAGKAAF